MIKYFSDRPQLSAWLTVLAGGIWAAMGVLQAARPDYLTTNVIETWAEHLVMAGLSAALLLVIASYSLLSRYATGSTPVKVIAAGTIALSITITCSNINGDDPSWFVVAAPISNALWFFGSVAFAVLLRRSGQVPAWVYVGVPLSWIAALPLSPLGGPVLTGGFWIAIGSLLLADSLVRAEPRAATA